MQTTQAHSGEWRGRFPYNEIISLLDVNRTFNLAESTSQDLTVGELLDLTGVDAVRDLKLGSRSAGAAVLRDAIADSCEVPAEQIVTTQGTALGLFLLAYEVCRPATRPCSRRRAFRRVATACWSAPARRCGSAAIVRERLPAGPQFDARLSSKTRLVSIASPQNPGGVQASRAEIDALLALMSRRCPDTVHRRDLSRSMLWRCCRGGQFRGGRSAHRHGFVGVESAGRTRSADRVAHVANAALRARLLVAKLNTVISGSVLDETLAATVLRHREHVLAPRRRLLADALDIVSGWCERERARVEWSAARCGRCAACGCADAFDEQPWRAGSAVPDHDVQLASGTWFGESSRVFRLGFGYLPLERLPPALTALSRAMDAAAA